MTYLGPSPTYAKARRREIALGSKRFRLTVEHMWSREVSAALRDSDGRVGSTHPSGLNLGEGGSRLYLGGLELMHTARILKSDELGARVDDDQLKELIETILRAELDKYGIVLQWSTRYDWEDHDRVLFMYFESEEIPDAT